MWRNYLQSLIGKKITGKFRLAFKPNKTYNINDMEKFKEYTFIIKSYYSYFNGTEIILVSDEGIHYVAHENERYVIR